MHASKKTITHIFVMVPLLLLLSGSLFTLHAAEKKFLIVQDPTIKVFEQADPEASFSQLPRLSVLEIFGTETMYQRSWYKVRYIDMDASCICDTSGFIEIAPDLKDIMPLSILNNAPFHLSLNPRQTINADLSKIKWDYTGTMHEDVQEGLSEYEEIVKEYYEITCRIFVPEKIDGIILKQPDSYYHAFSEKDAFRRVKAVTNNTDWNDLFKHKILSGFITERMTRDMVRASWGAPRRIQKGVPQIWLYGTSKNPLQVQFMKGRVSAWSK